MVSQQNGCSFSDTINVNMNSWTKPTNETNLFSFVVAPNPNNGQFALRFKANQNKIEVKVMNILGTTVYSSTHNNTSEVGIVLAEPFGVYFVEVSDTFGNYQTIKLIKNDY